MAKKKKPHARRARWQVIQFHYAGVDAQKVGATVQEKVLDEAERRWPGYRLAQIMQPFSMGGFALFVFERVGR